MGVTWPESTPTIFAFRVGSNVKWRRWKQTPASLSPEPRAWVIDEPGSGDWVAETAAQNVLGILDCNS